METVNNLESSEIQKAKSAIDNFVNRKKTQEDMEKFLNKN